MLFQEYSRIGTQANSPNRKKKKKRKKEKNQNPGFKKKNLKNITMSWPERYKFLGPKMREG